MSRLDSLAEKITELLDAERPTVDLSAMQATLDSISTRLEKLEMASQIPHSHHPSLDKLSVAEAIADQIFGSPGKEKACAFEPNGKPCDHCSMCNSRGF